MRKYSLKLVHVSRLPSVQVMETEGCQERDSDPLEVIHDLV